MERANIAVQPQPVTIYPIIASEKTIVSHLWNDRTTWYTESIGVIEDTLTDTGNHMNYTSDYVNWIDVSHNKIFDEQSLLSIYKPVITVDDVEKTEDDDYEIDYAAGSVEFTSSQGSGVVKATYHYENGSSFFIQPEVGKKLTVMGVQIQFTVDVTFDKTFVFQVRATNPADPQGDKIIVKQKYYNHIFNFIEASSSMYSSLIGHVGNKPLGGQGTEYDVQLFHIPYAIPIELNYSDGAEIMIKILDDSPIDAERVSSTFHCNSRQE